MDKIYIKNLGALALTLLIVFSLNSQDIHYSQFGNSPLNISPALTGAFDGDGRFGANYRSQWTNVPVSYQQFTGFYDTRFVRKDIEDKPFTPWAGGILFDYDRAGDSKMGLLQLGISGSYTLGLGKQSGLMIGGMVSGVQRSFDSGFLFFGDQYDGKDPLTATSETFVNQSKLYASFDLGLNYRFQKTGKRTELNLGLGAFHLNKPKRNFFDEEETRLPQRFSLFGLGTIQLTEVLDLRLEALHHLQGPHTETVLSAGLPIHLETKRTKELAIQPGISWRIDDAIIPYILFHYKKQWQAGLSYDINTSPFTEATLNRGGPEFSLIYIFKRPRELPFCPIYPIYL